MSATVATPVRAGKRERGELVEAYERYLVERDGVPGPDGRTLSLREPIMQRLAEQTVRYRGPVDATIFLSEYHRRTPGADTPKELLLLLAFVKINAQEAFAVDTIIRIRKNLSPIERRVLTQENYHTRLLLSAAKLYGLPAPGPLPPVPVLRVITQGVARTPSAIMHSLALASEIVGLASFLRLLRGTRETLREHPELRDAMEERLLQVFTDEIGHMSFNRLKVGRLGMAAARAMLPLLVAGFRNTLPELDRVSGGPMTLRDLEALSVDDLPESARRQAFIA
jgi:hypothetical protein